MLKSEILCIIISVNLLFYLIFSVYFDFYKKKSSSSPVNINSESRNLLNDKNNNISTWRSNIDLILVIVPSFMIWIIFLLSPLILFYFGESYTNYINSIPILGNEFMLQYISPLLITVGSIIAFLGRKARAEFAISWGIPQKLITDGIFKYIRHPLYSSYCFYFIGFFLLFPSWITIIPIFGVYGYYRTSIYEEGILKDYYNDYKDYCNHTGRFLPKIR